MKSNSFFSSSQPIEIKFDGMKKEKKIIEFLIYLKLKIIFFFD